MTISDASVALLCRSTLWMLSRVFQTEAAVAIMTRFPQGEANCWINEKLLFANMQAGTFLKGPAPAEDEVPK